MHLKRGHEIKAEPLIKGQPILAKYKLMKTTFFDVIHAEDVGLTVMWDRGTRLKVQIQPALKGEFIPDVCNVNFGRKLFECLNSNY